MSLAACSDGFAVVKGPQVEEAALASGALTRAELVVALEQAGSQATPVLTA